MDAKKRWTVFGSTAIVVIIIASVGFWWFSRDVSPQQSDCQVVAEMLDYASSQTGAIDSFDMSAVGDNPKPYLDSLDQLVKRESGYVDKISNPSIKEKAQKLVDSYKETAEFQKWSIENPDHPTPEEILSGKPTSEFQERAKKSQEISQRQEQRLKDLQGSCPGTSKPPSRL